MPQLKGESNRLLPGTRNLGPLTLVLTPQCGEGDPDIFFADRPREGRGPQRNREYISFFADDVPVLRGRTPMQCYTDFMTAFRCVSGGPLT